MKLSQLRPCDACGGKIAPAFHIVRILDAIITPDADRTLGLARMMQSLALAELMGDSGDTAVCVPGDQDVEAITELFICRACYLGDAIDIAAVAETRRIALENQS